MDAALPVLPFYINFLAVNPVLSLVSASALQPPPNTNSPRPAFFGAGLYIGWSSKSGHLCGFDHSSAARCLSCFSGFAFGSRFNTSRCTRIRSRDGEGNQIFPEAGGEG